MVIRASRHINPYPISKIIGYMFRTKRIIDANVVNGNNREAISSNLGKGGMNIETNHATKYATIGIHQVVTKQAQINRAYFKRPPKPVIRLKYE